MNDKFSLQGIENERDYIDRSTSLYDDLYGKLNSIDERTGQPYSPYDAIEEAQYTLGKMVAKSNEDKFKDLSLEAFTAHPKWQGVEPGTRDKFLRKYYQKIVIPRMLKDGYNESQVEMGTWEYLRYVDQYRKYEPDAPKGVVNRTFDQPQEEPEKDDVGDPGLRGVNQLLNLPVDILRGTALAYRAIGALPKPAQVGLGLVTAPVSLPVTLAAMSPTVRNFIANRYDDLAELTEQGVKKVEFDADPATGKYAEGVDEFADLWDTGRLRMLVTESAPSSIALMSATLLNPSIGIPAVASVYAGQFDQEMKDMNIPSNLSDDQKAGIAVLVGATQAGLERTGAEALFGKSLGVVRNRLLRTLIATGAETTEEGLQGAVSRLGQAGYEEFNNVGAGDVWDRFYTDMLSALPLSMLFGGASSVRKAPAQPKAEGRFKVSPIGQAIKDAGTFKNIFDDPLLPPGQTEALVPDVVSESAPEVITEPESVTDIPNVEAEQEAITEPQMPVLPPPPPEATPSPDAIRVERVDPVTNEVVDIGADPITPVDMSALNVVSDGVGDNTMKAVLFKTAGVTNVSELQSSQVPDVIDALQKQKPRKPRAKKAVTPPVTETPVESGDKSYRRRIVENHLIDGSLSPDSKLVDEFPDLRKKYGGTENLVRTETSVTETPKSEQTGGVESITVPQADQLARDRGWSDESRLKAIREKYPNSLIGMVDASGDVRFYSKDSGTVLGVTGLNNLYDANRKTIVIRKSMTDDNIAKLVKAGHRVLLVHTDYDLSKQTPPASEPVTAPAPKVEPPVKVSFNDLPKYVQNDIALTLLEKIPEFKDHVTAENVGYELDQVRLDIETVDVKSLKNPKQFAEDVADMYSQLTTEAPPILVDGNTVIEGGHRFEAAKKRGDKTIRVINLDLKGKKWGELALGNADSFDIGDTPPAESSQSTVQAEQGAEATNVPPTPASPAEGTVSLENEARKYKTADEFRKAYTARSLMDLSDPAKHRWGRIFEDGYDETTGLYLNAKVASDIYGKRGNKSYGDYPEAKVPDVTSEDQLVTIYRGTVEGQAEMLPGDFVSFNKEYALSHNEGKKLLTLKVPAKDVVWQGNDFHEWIYSPESIRGKKYIGGLRAVWERVNSEATTTPADTPKEAVAEIIEGKRESTIGGKEFKVKMLAELDALIDQFKNKKTPYPETVTIEIPGDGSFTLDIVRMMGNQRFDRTKGTTNSIEEQLGEIRAKVKAISDTAKHGDTPTSLKYQKPPRSVPLSKFNDEATAKKLGYTKAPDGGWVHKEDVSNQLYAETRAIEDGIREEYRYKETAIDKKYDRTLKPYFEESESIRTQVRKLERRADKETDEAVIADISSQIASLNEKGVHKANDIWNIQDEQKKEKDDLQTAMFQDIDRATKPVKDKYNSLYPDLFAEQKATDEGIKLLHAGLTPDWFVKQFSELARAADKLTGGRGGKLIASKWERITQDGYRKRVESWFARPRKILERIRTGKELFLPTVQRIYHYEGMYRADFQYEVNRATTDLQSSDIDWLNANGKRYVETESTAELPNPRIAKWIRTYRELMNHAGVLIMDNGVMVNYRETVNEKRKDLQWTISNLEMRIQRGEKNLGRTLAGAKRSLTSIEAKRNAGVIYTGKTRRMPFTPRKNYVPHYLTPEASRIINIGAYGGGGVEYKQILEWCRENGVDITELQKLADGSRRTIFDNVNGNIEESRNINIPDFIGDIQMTETDILGITNTYIHNTAKRLAIIRGIRETKGYSRAEIDDYHEAIRAFGRNVQDGILEDGITAGESTAVEAGLAKAVWEHVIGVEERPAWTTNETAGAALKGIGVAETIGRTAWLSQAAIPNYVGGWFPIFTQAGVRNAALGVVDFARMKMGDKEAIQFFEDAQKLATVLMNDMSMIGETRGMTGKAGKMGYKFLKWTLFKHANNTLSSAATFACKRWVDNRLDLIRSGHSQSSMYRDELKQQLYWDDAKLDNILENGIESDPYAMGFAIQTFLAKTNVVRENPLDVPPWMNSWYGKKVVSLTSFMRAMGNLLSDGIYQWRKHKNPTKLVTLMFGAQASEYAIDLVRGFIQDREDKDENWLDKFAINVLQNSSLGLWGTAISNLVWSQRMQDSVIETTGRFFIPPAIDFWVEFGTRFTNFAKKRDEKAFIRLTKVVPLLRTIAANSYRIKEGSMSTYYDSGKPKKRYTNEAGVVPAEYDTVIPAVVAE